MAKNVVMHTAKRYARDGLWISFARLNGERVYCEVTQSSRARFIRAMGGLTWESKITEGGWLVYDLMRFTIPF